MPYIKQDDRAKLDEAIDSLAIQIKGTIDKVDGVNHQDCAGKLNYVVSRLIIGIMGDVRYWKIALYCGVLHNIATEFYRKVATPYEDKKIEQNGDLPWPS